MDWKDQCFLALDRTKMFENTDHRTRFKELVDCYNSYPFFTPGLCKCMYLAAWDQEHFCVLLEALMELSIGKKKTTADMREKGKLLAEETTDSEQYVYLLSNSFLDGTPFHLKDDAPIDPEVRHIIERALQAAELIDQLDS